MASTVREPRFVVDDGNLTDLESSGWCHYLPWKFIETIRANDGAVEIPAPIDEIPDVPLTEPSCLKSYPSIDDEPRLVQYR